MGENTCIAYTGLSGLLRSNKYRTVSVLPWPGGQAKMYATSVVVVVVVVVAQPDCLSTLVRMSQA